ADAPAGPDRRAHRERRGGRRPCHHRARARLARGSAGRAADTTGRALARAARHRSSRPDPALPQARCRPRAQSVAIPPLSEEAARMLNAPISRRVLLRGSAALGAGLFLPRTLRGFAASAPIRPPDSLPNAGLPPGVDTLPQIEHIIVVMMENHSFDNYLGTLGRGDGFSFDGMGRPSATNPDADGRLIRAFHLPSTCQLHGSPSH